jgi:hypothetical protein
LLPYHVWGVQTRNSTRAQSAGLEAADDASEVSGVSDLDNPRRRGRSLKGVGRAVKRRTSVWESDDEADAPEAEVEPKEGLKGVDPSPKASRRSRYKFPEELHAADADHPRFVKMSIPERLAPKVRTYTIAQEYSWACSFVGEMRKVQDGSVSGSWARLVEVMAGARSPMMEEANREMRETDLRVRRWAAEDRAERKQAQLRETFLRRVSQHLDVPDDVAEQMWAPALAFLQGRHKEWIEEDLKELEELIREAEAWRVQLPDNEPGPHLGLPDDENGPDPGTTGPPACAGVAAGLAVAVGARLHT